jgi:DNA (cytosine-5)-methyltransferase 1
MRHPRSGSEQKASPRLNSIELFAGSGGLGLGLEMAGFVTRALVERDEFCCETLRTNASKYFPKAAVIQRDISEMSPSDLLNELHLDKSDVTLVAGGPPCQGFSISKIPKGGRKLDDPRDNMVLHFARFVRDISPPAFLMENVPGMLSKDDGKVFAFILETFRKIGYDVNWKILNAADFGAPQLRRRVFILGSKGKQLEFPHHTHSSVYPNLLGLPRYRTIRDAFAPLTPDMPNQTMPRHTRKKVELLRGIKPGAAWQKWRFRDPWDRPSRTITGHCRDDWVHPEEPRTGTVRELATIQTYPTDYTFCGPIMALNNVKFNFQYRQVGNSVPVLVGKALGESIINQLERVRVPIAKAS